MRLSWCLVPLIPTNVGIQERPRTFNWFEAAWQNKDRRQPGVLTFVGTSGEGPVGSLLAAGAQSTANLPLIIALVGFSPSSRRPWRQCQGKMNSPAQIPVFASRAFSSAPT